MGFVVELSQNGSEISGRDMVDTSGGDHQQLDQVSGPPKQLWARECRTLYRAVFLRAVLGAMAESLLGMLVGAPGAAPEEGHEEGPGKYRALPQS